MRIASTLERALHYIESHYMNNLTLDDIAMATGVSKFALNRLFLKYLGTTPSKWIWQFRTHVAAFALRYGRGLTCREIAYACGFETPAHFSRVFRDYVGDTPLNFKSRNDGWKGLAIMAERAKRAFVSDVGYCSDTSEPANT